MKTDRDWVITYKSGRAAVQLWAVIVDVPAGCKLDDVIAALETWQRWPQWQQRVRAGAVLAVRARRASDDAQIGDETRGVHRIEWDELSPRSKQVQIKVSGQQYAAMVRASRVSGLSLSRWAINHLAAAAGADLAAVEEGRPPAFLDEPLPGMVP